MPRNSRPVIVLSLAAAVAAMIAVGVLDWGLFRWVLAGAVVWCSLSVIVAAAWAVVVPWLRRRAGR
jgi:hypothetical protein